MSDLRDQAGGNPRAYRNARLGAWLALACAIGLAAGASAWNALPRTGAAPDFSLTTTGLEEGAGGQPQALRLEGLRGRTVVLDFMAVSCLSCRVVTAEVLVPLQAAHPDVHILSIDIWSDPAFGALRETEEDLRRLQAEEGLRWPHARDTDQVHLKYGVFGLPRLVVVDPDGQVVLSRDGIPAYATVERVVRAAEARAATGIPMLTTGLAASTVLAGALAVLSPCSIGLLPAYVGLLVARAPSPAGPAGAGQAAQPSWAGTGPAASETLARRQRGWRALQAGAATAAGILAFYAVLAVALAGLGWLGLGAWLRASLPRASLAIGALLIAAGLLMALRGGSRRWARWTHALGQRIPGRSRPLWWFGAAYGAAAFGCSGPAVLALLLVGFAQGFAAGATLFALFAGVVTAVAVGVAALVAASPGPRAGWTRNAARLQRAGGLLMAASGTYLLWFASRGLS